jgi:thymidine kinase
MNSSKSANLLMVAHNYEEQGKNVLLFSPTVDDRYAVGKITSRSGMQHDAIGVDDNTDLYGLVAFATNHMQEIHCVLVDEAQFLKKEHVMQFAKIVDNLNIPVIAYGLKNDFRNELFEGSKYLLLLSDKIEEIKTVCHFCNHKATMILRTAEGKPVYEGEQIVIGGNDTYIPVCRYHYQNPELVTLK